MEQSEMIYIAVSLVLGVLVGLTMGYNRKASGNINNELPIKTRGKGFESEDNHILSEFLKKRARQTGDWYFKEDCSNPDYSRSRMLPKKGDSPWLPIFLELLSEIDTQMELKPYEDRLTKDYGDKIIVNIHFS